MAGNISEDVGRRVQIRRTDDGAGWIEVDRRGVFEPFHRQRDVPAGYRLGSAMARAGISTAPVDSEAMRREAEPAEGTAP